MISQPGVRGRCISGPLARETGARQDPDVALRRGEDDGVSREPLGKRLEGLRRGSVLDDISRLSRQNGRRKSEEGLRGEVCDCAPGCPPPPRCTSRSSSRT